MYLNQKKKRLLATFEDFDNKLLMLFNCSHIGPTMTSSSWQSKWSTNLKKHRGIVFALELGKVLPIKEVVLLLSPHEHIGQQTSNHFPRKIVGVFQAVLVLPIPIINSGSNVIGLVILH